MVKDTFRLFDKDNGGEIDREEALEHWKTSFGKISAKHFFD